MHAHRTHPFDVVLGLRLLTASGTLAQLAEELAVVPSQVHASIRRLDRAGLLRPESRSVNARALGEFVLFGVRYAFPAVRGMLADGVPTAHSAQPLAALIDAVDVVVWPAPAAPDAVRGFSIRPLYGRAPTLVQTSPETYRLVTLVDALRLGDPRARTLARAELESALGSRSGSASESPPR
jgi:DNA-binding Lrp family transcriptional regulator